MRNQFVGGPNDGEVHLTFDLLTDDQTRNSIPWEEYVNDGPQEAADGEVPLIVWRHTGAIDRSDAQPAAPAAAAQVQAVDQPAQPDTPLGDLPDGYYPPDDAPPVDQPTAPKPEKSAIRVRRETLKVKRQELADASGVTIGVLARIETKGGTDEELAPVLAKLDELEAARG